MPLTRIAIRSGKTPEYKQPLMDEIYAAMHETVASKDGDRFMAITGERLGRDPGVRPEDVPISVTETAAENWSFGNDETQFY
jgi:4-oxalocrotonate tautomerase